MQNITDRNILNMVLYYLLYYLPWSVKDSPHYRYQEANFCHKLYNLVKMIVLIVFSIAENIGLPGYFVKIRQKIIPHISIFWSRIQDTAVKGLCSWSQPACKTLTLNYTRNTPISRSRDPTGQSLYHDDEFVHLYPIRWSRDSGGHVTSSTRCILHWLSPFVGQLFMRGL